MTLTLKKICKFVFTAILDIIQFEFLRMILIGFSGWDLKSTVSFMHLKILFLCLKRTLMVACIFSHVKLYFFHVSTLDANAQVFLFSSLKELQPWNLLFISFSKKYPLELVFKSNAPYRSQNHTQKGKGKGWWRNIWLSGCVRNNAILIICNFFLLQRKPKAPRWHRRIQLILIYHWVE